MKYKHDDDWAEVWTKGFPNLRKLNARNCAFDVQKRIDYDSNEGCLLRSVFEITG